MEAVCMEHSGHRARIETIEKTNAEQWVAIGEIRTDIKAMLLKIGMLVGGISIVNSLAIGVTVYYMTKG